MTDMVKCRVCDCLAPLGTVECPDCGAPLPQEIPKEPPQPVEAARPAEGEGPREQAATKKRNEFLTRHPVLRRVALLVAVCLAVQGAVLWWPQKPTPPGVYCDGENLITPEGVWNYEAEGFVRNSATSDWRYVLLQRAGDSDVQARLRGVAEVLDSTRSKLGSSMSYTYALDGDYYLFDGRALERTDWTQATLTNAGTVFYTQEDESGATLGWRDLNTGKEHTFQTMGEGMELDAMRVSDDGMAAAYRWRAEDAEEAGPYRLWRAKDRKTVTLDAPGELLQVGKEGETCLFWQGGVDVLYGWEYEYVDGDYNGTLRGSESGYYLWRDGDIVPLSNMMAVWVNTDYTQLIFRDYREDMAGDWYYFDLNAMDAPRRLDVPGDCYLSSAGLYQDYRFDTLTGHFYIAYGNGDVKLYYLTRKGELVHALDGLEGSFLLDSEGRNAVYLKGGDLYRLSVHSDDTLETQRLTYTDSDNAMSFAGGSGAITAFAANEDLSHIYYQMRNDPDFYASRVLFHWHNGESHMLELDINSNYGTVPMTVTADGGCYFTYTRNLYYTKGDEPPVMLLEEIGMNAAVQLVGPERWPLLPGARWEDGKNQRCYWRLNGADGPTELIEWYPQEGTV